MWPRTTSSSAGASGLLAREADAEAVAAVGDVPSLERAVEAEPPDVVNPIFLELGLADSEEVTSA